MCNCAQTLLYLSASDSTALVKAEEVGSILNDSVNGRQCAASEAGTMLYNSRWC